MIDKLTIFLPHFLMALAIWRLLRRDDLNDDPALPRQHAPATRSRKQGGQEARRDA